MKLTSRDWESIWTKFNSWCDGFSKFCDSCKQMNSNMPEWEDQEKKIRKLVTKALKEKGG